MVLRLQPQLFIELPLPISTRHDRRHLRGQLVVSVHHCGLVKVVHPEISRRKRSDAALSLHQSAPRRLDAASEGCDHAQTCDDDAAARGVRRWIECSGREEAAPDWTADDAAEGVHVRHLRRQRGLSWRAVCVLSIRVSYLSPTHRMRVNRERNPLL